MADAVDSVHTPAIVYVDVGVREFRVNFTGEHAYKAPVEVKAYGRLVGTWFPAGTLPASIAPSPPRDPHVSPGVTDPRLLGPDLPTSGNGSGPSRTTPQGAPLTERQRQRDSWLRGVRKVRGEG